MIIEKTGRTKICTDCGMVAHNTVMQSHSCEQVETVKKVVKKVTKKAKK